MNYLLSYCQAGFGDVLVSTPFIKDFNMQHPNDKLFFQFAMPYMKAYYDIFDNNPHFNKYSGNAVIDKDIHFGWGEPSNVSESRKLYLDCSFKYIDVIYNEFNLRSGTVTNRTLEAIDIYLSNAEKNLKFDWRDSSRKLGIVNDGYNYFLGNAKNWGWEKFQYVVDSLKDQIQFVQVGMRKNGYFQRPLNNVIDLVDKTDIRQLMSLMYQAEFVLTHDTSTYHLAMMDVDCNRNPRNVAVILGARSYYSYLETYKSKKVNTLFLRNNEQYLKCFDNGKYTCDCIDVFTTAAGRCTRSPMCKIPSVTINGETVCACFSALHPDNVVKFFKEHL